MRVQLIQGIYLFEGLLSSRVVKGLSWFKNFKSGIRLNSNVNWGNSLDNSRVQFNKVFKWLNYFKGIPN